MCHGQVPHFLPWAQPLKRPLFRNIYVFIIFSPKTPFLTCGPVLKAPIFSKGPLPKPSIFKPSVAHITFIFEYPLRLSGIGISSPILWSHLLMAQRIVLPNSLLWWELGNFPNHRSRVLANDRRFSVSLVWSEATYRCFTAKSIKRIDGFWLDWIYTLICG